MQSHLCIGLATEPREQGDVLHGVLVPHELALFVLANLRNNLIFDTL